MRLKLNDELKKLGLRIRPRTVTDTSQSQPQSRPRTRSKPGQIAFDDRGNAVYEWDQPYSADSEEAERLRRKALTHPGLALVDDEPPVNAPIRANPRGLRVGYNPYESGVLVKQSYRRKRNLHELSKWIETRKRLKAKPEED